jgi:hypothetical protein
VGAALEEERREMKLWEMELQQIEETTSPDAMADLWAEVLAGLGGVCGEDLDRLGLKAQSLAAEERDQELREYLDNRIDEIIFAAKVAAKERH